MTGGSTGVVVEPSTDCDDVPAVGQGDGPSGLVPGRFTVDVAAELLVDVQRTALEHTDLARFITVAVVEHRADRHDVTGRRQRHRTPRFVAVGLPDNGVSNQLPSHARVVLQDTNLPSGLSSAVVKGRTNSHQKTIVGERHCRSALVVRSIAENVGPNLGPEAR